MPLGGMPIGVAPSAAMKLLMVTEAKRMRMPFMSATLCTGVFAREQDAGLGASADRAP